MFFWWFSLLIYKHSSFIPSPLNFGEVESNIENSQFQENDKNDYFQKYNTSQNRKSPIKQKSYDYSSQIFENLSSTIVIDNNYEFNSIHDSNFTNPQLPEEQNYLFIVRKEFIFENVTFLIDSSFNQKCGAIKVESSDEVIIRNCRFIGCGVSGNDGNAILLATKKASSINNKEEKNFGTLIDDCQFIECYFNDKSGITILANESNYFCIQNSTFIGCSGGIEIRREILYSCIEQCVFTDCRKIEGSVIIISNQNCIFNNNVVNFTDNRLYSSSAMHISSHGNIIVTNNFFHRIRNTNEGGIFITDSESDNYDNCTVIFNYNTIQEVGNVKFGTFNIVKFYDFNFDHNIIKNCIINDYSCQINLSLNKFFQNSYTLTNLTLLNCETISMSGGLGLYLVFNSTESIFIINDCKFENNKSNGKEYYTGCGGAFSSESIIESQMELLFVNSSFIENYAESWGGALSIRSSLPILIENCTFLNNSALSAGAIYIDPMDFPDIGPLPNCTISSSVFKYNYDFSNYCHAILCLYDDNCKTVFKINDCLFIDNCISESDLNDGFTIQTSSPTFIFENSKIIFSSVNISTSGLKIYDDTEYFYINSCQFEQNGCLQPQYSYLQYSSILIENNKTSTITNSSFLKGHCNQGEIIYTPYSKTKEDIYLIIEKCFFNECKGCSVYIHTFFDSTQHIVIIECTFQNSIPSEKEEKECAVIHPDSGCHLMAINIEKCIFNNCWQDENYYLILYDSNSKDSGYDIEDIIIKDNIISYDDSNNASFAMKISAYDRNILIQNCSFINSNTNTILVDKFVDINISNCSFNKCGNIYRHAIIVQGERDTFCTICNIENCTFNSTLSAIYSYVEGLKIRENIFYNCNEVPISVSGYTSSDCFELTGNQFIDCNMGCIVHSFIVFEGTSIRNAPVIYGNLFENAYTFGENYQLEQQNVFIFEVESEMPFVFENNIFSGFKTHNGGFGGYFKLPENSILDLTFYNCSFINNSCILELKGGAFGNNEGYNNNNFYLTMDKCYFDKNNAPRYGGGSIFILTELDVTIKNCYFTFNPIYNESEIILFRSNIFIEKVRNIIVQDCIFENKFIVDYQEMYIINSSQFVLTNCSFFNGYKSDEYDLSYIYKIEINSQCIDISNNKFEDENIDKNYGEIKISKLIETNIINNTFIKITPDQKVLLIETSYYDDERSYYIYVTNCTFDKCIGTCCCFIAYYYINMDFNINECKFQNIQVINNLPVLILGTSTQLGFNITKCLFENCVADKTGSLIKSKVDYITQPDGNAYKNIVISDCTFIFKDVEDGCIAIKVSLPDKNLYISNCTFAKCHLTDRSNIWSNTIGIDDIINVIISNCSFIECGINNEFNEGGNVIGIFGNHYTYCIIENCSFTSSTAVIFIYTDNVSVTNCLFDKCGRNIFEVHRVSLDSRGFELIDNHFVNCYYGGLIHSARCTAKYEPKIIGNVFENVNTNDPNIIYKYAFCFLYEEEVSIIFDNNTFINFNVTYGGIGLIISEEMPSGIDRQVNLTFNNCFFINNNQSSNGGAFCSTTDQNKGYLNYFFENCYFENNEVNESGGVLYISNKLDVIIHNCSFMRNKANEYGGAICIVSSDNENQMRYCEITNCIFNSNKGKDGFAIYVRNDTVGTLFNITENVFINNYNKETINDAAIITSEFCNLSRHEIINGNEFTNQEEGTDINVNIFACVFNDVAITSSDEITSNDIDIETSDELSSSEHDKTIDISSESDSSEIILDVSSDIYSSETEFIETSEIESAEYESSIEYDSSDASSSEVESFETSEDSSVISESSDSIETSEDSSVISESSDSIETSEDSSVISESSDSIEASEDSSVISESLDSIGASEDSSVISESSDSIETNEDSSINFESSSAESDEISESFESIETSEYGSNSFVSFEGDSSETILDLSTNIYESIDASEEQSTNNDEHESSEASVDSSTNNELPGFPTDDEQSESSKYESSNNDSTETKLLETPTSYTEFIKYTETITKISQIETKIVFSYSSQFSNVIGSNVSNDKNKISTAAIIGIVCGISVVLIAASTIVIIWVKKRKNQIKRLNKSISKKDISSPETKGSKSSFEQNSITIDDEEMDLDFWL